MITIGTVITTSNVTYEVVRGDVGIQVWLHNNVAHVGLQSFRFIERANKKGAKFSPLFFKNLCGGMETGKYFTRILGVSTSFDKA